MSQIINFRAAQTAKKHGAPVAIPSSHDCDDEVTRLAVVLEIDRAMDLCRKYGPTRARVILARAKEVADQYAEGKA